jgi:hypothetical protein
LWYLHIGVDRRCSDAERGTIFGSRIRSDHSFLLVAGAAPTLAALADSATAAQAIRVAAEADLASGEGELLGVAAESATVAQEEEIATAAADEEVAAATGTTCAEVAAEEAVGEVALGVTSAATGVLVVVGVAAFLGLALFLGEPPAHFDLGPQYPVAPQRAPTPGQAQAQPKIQTTPTPPEQENRGSIQIQGKDINAPGNTISWSWSRTTPVPASEGLAELASLWDTLSRGQKKQRDEAYPRIVKYITNAPPTGIPPNWPGKTFQNRQTRTGTERIDLVVVTGIAFDVP